MSKDEHGDDGKAQLAGHDDQRHDLESQEKDDDPRSPAPPRSPASSSTLSNGRTIIQFEKGDPDNPRNWSSRRKTVICGVGILTVINSTLGSALPSNAVSYISEDFHITNEVQLVLPISVYLIGYVVGPLFLGPLSEAYGRKMLMICPFTIFTIFTMACALAPTWPALLVFRFIVGVMASSPISVVGGIYADIYDDPVTRGRAMALFMAATTLGPLTAPIVSGFISVVSWRWTFWVALIVAGVSWIPVLLLPETYAPVLLEKRAKRVRKEGQAEIWAPIEMEDRRILSVLSVTLTRPIRMVTTEAIVLFTCLYLSLCYALFYLFFEAYPIIFQGIYGMSTGVSGLAFLPIGVGAAISGVGFVYYDLVLHRAKQRGAPWAHTEEYRRLPLACIGGPIFSVSLFWLGWSARPSVHWIVPMLAGLPFGIGFLLIFMAFLNYLTDAYEVYAASALAAASCCRSIFGAVLPFAAKPMYSQLGVNWASSLLGFLSLGMVVIPFVFIRCGERIRGGSRFCQELKARRRQDGGDGCSMTTRTEQHDHEDGAA